MEPLFASLEKKWQRIYFDLPGMGRTPGKPWIDGSDRMLDFVLEFIDAIIPNQRFLVAGESYGGYLARGVVNKRFDLVDGMLLICPTANQETRLANAPAHQVLERDEAFMQSLSKEDRESYEFYGVVQNQRGWERYRDEILPALKMADYGFLENSLGRNASYSFDVDQFPKPFMKPTLMLTGRQDSAVGYSDLWKVIENYPRASFAVLDKAGHNLQIDQERLFTELVREWLNRVSESKLPA
jgi:pimeloyl-ACP methyl ester carboxylesterase